MKIIPVILSGGSGTRLWPLSRKMFPKQFLSLVSDETMLQTTLSRLEGLELSAPIIVCNEDHRFIVAEQMRQMGVEHPHIILEPEGKNTAPAIALAAIYAQQNFADDALMLVLSADHVIQNIDAFHKAIALASTKAQTNKLVTFGVVPTHPETGYGYIQYEKTDKDIFDVADFVEKPNLEKAKSYVNEGNFLWNSGMFLFKPDCFLNELKLHQSDIYKVCSDAMKNEQRDFDFIRVDKEIFHQSPSDSIDYAVMEKTDLAMVVPLDAGWNDIGSWASLWEVNEKDEQGNSIHGDVLLHDSHNNLVMSENKLVTAIGVDDLIIVETKDAIMVAKKDKSQQVKEIVDQLKALDREEANFHRVVYRPWGCFDSVEEGDRFKVKRITVKPGAKLSLQMHHHRAEHWVVVSGTAKVQRDEETLLLTENESIYLHVGQKHSLENPGQLPLEIIEIQTGSYLGEDDIVRFEDKYGRA